MKRDSTNVQDSTEVLPFAKPVLAAAAYSRAKELIDDIKTEIIVDKNLKLFNELKAKEMSNQFYRCQQRFEKPNGVSNNLFICVMLVMAILGLIAAWLSW